MLDLNFVRSHFPGLKSDWIFMDNAGGSQILQPVIDRMLEFFRTSNVQLGASYYPSDLATERVAKSHSLLASYVNAEDPGELVMGSSTSMLVRIMAMNLGKYLPKGSEIIVTNCDHEANIGAWRELEQVGFVIKTWRLNEDSFQLEIDDLRKLLSDKTRLVAFTHTSNLLGTVHPVKEITRVVHEAGAWVCVDAVAYAPHRMIDVRDWGVDFYVFSFYKTFGPHYAMLYGKKNILLDLPGNNHFFIGKEESHYKFQPGHVNFEIAWGITGLLDYYTGLFRHHSPEPTEYPIRKQLAAVFDLIREHEHQMTKLVLDFLTSKPGIRIIGSKLPSPDSRVPTISFVKDKLDSESIVLQVDKHKIGIRFGDFYARRLVDDLGLSAQNGVVRISLVHYNTLEEVQRLIRVLDMVL